MNDEYYNPYYSNMPQPRRYGDSGEYGDWGPQGNQMNYGQALGGLSAGLAAGQTASANNFQMNDGGVYGAVAQGAISGSAAGPVGAAVGAVVGGVSNFYKQDKQLKNTTENVNTAFNGTNDMYGRPVYQSGEFAQGMQDFQGLMEATRPGAHALRPKRRRQMEKKSYELYQGIQQGQQNYNQSESNFRNKRLSTQEYYERLNRNRAMYQY